MMLRVIFESKIAELIGKWRKIHHGKLNDLYCSTTFFRVTKSRIM